MALEEMAGPSTPLSVPPSQACMVTPLSDSPCRPLGSRLRLQYLDSAPPGVWVSGLLGCCRSDPPFCSWYKGTLPCSPGASPKLSPNLCKLGCAKNQDIGARRDGSHL
jgi:hypothetical protein